MAVSITEAYDLCPETGGFNTVMNCVSSLTAKLHRAGSDDEQYMMDLNPVVVTGNMYTFAFPVSVYSMPVGYYDVDFFDGDLFKKTVRFNLHTSSNAGATTEIITDCTDNRKVAPNVTVPVECDDKKVECPTCEVEIVQVEFGSGGFGFYSPPLSQSEEDAIAERQEMAALQAMIQTPIAFEFPEAQEYQALADFYDDLFQQGGVVLNGVLV